MARTPGTHPRLASLYLLVAATAVVLHADAQGVECAEAAVTQACDESDICLECTAVITGGSFSDCLSGIDATIGSCEFTEQAACCLNGVSGIDCVSDLATFEFFECVYDLAEPCDASLTCSGDTTPAPAAASGTGTPVAGGGGGAETLAPTPGAGRPTAPTAALADFGTGGPTAPTAAPLIFGTGGPTAPTAAPLIFGAGGPTAPTAAPLIFGTGGPTAPTAAPLIFGAGGPTAPTAAPPGAGGAETMRPSAAADDGVTRAPSDTTAPAGAGGAETMMPTVSADGGRPAAPSDTTAPAADGATPTASPTAAIPAASQMATATSSGGAPVGPIVGGVLGVLVLGGIVMAVAIKTGCFKSCSYGTAPNATIPVGGAAAAPQTSSVQPVGSSGDSATQYPVAHQYPVAYPYPEARESLPASERSAIE